ncbi:MAG: MFS transporter [Alphaproteobacteria bacterium]|jgi:UMF1 family MFS transporter|nr:MFS transporter [Alphaproteobacteria bacterium]MDP6515612.1 MFS transporter [Alphaproteobacteria bacterium]
MADHEVGRDGPGRRSKWSAPAWCLFDWANSPFPTVIVTFVFAVYFQRAIVGDAIVATALWGWAMAASALAVAIAGPVLGAIADAGGRRKPWLLACSALTVVTCAGLWFAVPGRESLLLVLVLVGLGNFGFELGTIFYNAMLPGLARPGRIGRLSGWAWALGYGGGLACLVVALFGLVQADPPPFGLAAESAEPVRAVALLVALWFVAFAWPLFVATPDLQRTNLTIGHSVSKGLDSLLTTIRRIRKHRHIAWFLLARMLYIDGLNTLFAFGGLYAAGTFAMEMTEVMVFGIALNVAAGLGAFGFAWIDDLFGAKRTIVLSLLALLILGAAILLVESKTWFWVLGLAIGVFMGPVQSASRSMMGRLAPAALRTEMFGLYALSGKATAFMGPWLVGLVTALAASQRVGMAVILAFFLIGLLVLLRVPEPDGPPNRSVNGGNDGYL